MIFPMLTTLMKKAAKMIKLSINKTLKNYNKT